MWKKYNTATHRLCPSHNLEDLSDGQYDDMLGGFLQGLPAETRVRISKIVDYQKPVLQERLGLAAGLPQT